MTEDPPADPAPGPSDPIWGVGAVRSLTMYESYSGVDFRAKRVSGAAERGGVPGEEFFWDRFAMIGDAVDDGIGNGGKGGHSAAAACECD